MADDWEARVKALYRLDPEEFVAARNELAKEIRGEDRKAASAIRNLVKPTVVAWAINQVALTKPKLVAAVLSATDDLRSAQDKAFAGDRGALKTATESRRKAIASVVDAAIGVLDAKGRTGESHREAIRNTVEAASVEPAAAEVLQEGRLEHEMDAPATFGSLEAFAAEAPSPRSERRARRKADTATAPEEDPEELRREARRARAEAEDLAELAATARARAQEAAQVLKEARQAVEAAEAQVKEAKRDLDRKMEAAKTTSMRAAEVERSAEEAKARCEQLEAALNS